jgi:hypothetical protein
MNRRRWLQRVLRPLYEGLGLEARQDSGRFGEQSGQVMVEYVITVVLATLGLIGIGSLMHAAIGRYLLEIYFFVALPIP